MTEPTKESGVESYIRAQLYTAVIGDILDQMGCLHQFLPAEVRPLTPKMVLIGRAMPVQLATATGVEGARYGKLTEALDELRVGEVYVATGGSIPCASWGELMTAAARKRGGAGAVVNGYHRDTGRVLSQGWPVFSRGSYAQDAAFRSNVVAYRTAIDISGVVVNPGDLVFGDGDGVVIVPQGIERDVLVRAAEKVRSEGVARRAIEAGMSAAAAFATYGVL